MIEQMYRLINEIILALENKQYCTALFMDIEKAFDKINHESLLQTIRKQFPEQIYQLIKSYLSGRTFVIKIRDTYSEVKDIKAGVSQGSVLGPILYTLYRANIPTTINSKILTFADNTAILFRYTNPETAVKLLQEHITKIEKWLQEKQIKANPNKCNHITFTLRKQIPPNILLNGTHITQTKQVKYLGLHLDTQLTWKQHTKSIINKIQTTRRQMHWLTSRKSKLSIENKLKIYKTIIKSIWTYGILLWGTAAMSHINKIETIQAKILKTIVNAPWYVRNEDIRTYQRIPTVKEEINRYAERYKERIATHPNRLAAETINTSNMEKRLKRKHPADLTKDIT